MTGSEWVVITKNDNVVKALDTREWETVESDSRPWTDDYSNFISTLKILNERDYSKYKKEEKK